MKLRLLKSSLIEIINEAVKDFVDELDEATVSANIDGYNTPFAFGDKSDKSKKKKIQVSTNSTGYRMIEGKVNKKELQSFIKEYLESNFTDPKKALNLEINITEDIKPADMSLIKRLIRREVAQILRDLWFKRATWSR